MQHDDEPTVPIQGWYEPDVPAEPGALGNMPTWPPSGERGLRFPGRDRLPSGYTSAMVLGISLGANVVLLIGLIALLLLGHTGFFAPSGSSGQPSLRGSNSASANSSLTATASSVSRSSWLQVTPSSVQIGCGSGQKTQFAVLENTGPENVQWQANLAVPANQAGVAISPSHGDLAAGASVSLQIRNTTDSDGSQGASSQRGVILFEPTSTDAGSPPSINYTITGCQ
jgi:hypothetical protein